MGWDCVITHLKYGDRFRKHRKWIQNAFQEKTSLASYRPVQRREAYVLLSGLAETPSALMSHLRRLTVFHSAATAVLKPTAGSQLL